MSTGHKSVATRQQEAKERKRKYLPARESVLADAIAYAKRNKGDDFAAAQVLRDRNELECAYVEAGYPLNEAFGMANAAAQGKPGAWISGMGSGFDGAAQAEPNNIKDAIIQIIKLVPGVSAVLLLPHPSRPAIHVRADADDCDGSLSIDMSIVEIDALAKALFARGVLVFLDEVKYYAHCSPPNVQRPLAS